MKKLSIILVLVLVASTAFSMVKFNAGITQSMFTDTRLTGTNQTFSVSYDIGDIEASWLFETAKITVTDETTGTGLASAEQINAVRMVKDLGIAGIGAGIELGSVGISAGTGLAAGRGAPLMGLVGQWSYEQKGKDVTTAISVNIGYRMADINDVATIGGSAVPVKNLNALGLGLSISIGF